MSLQQDIMSALKEAMKSKDQTALTALRAVKSAILLAQTESGAKEELTEEQELKILQKQVKQRRDSASIYLDQGREDLAAPELAEAEVIAQFLPEALSEEAITEVVVSIIKKVGAEGMKDMGKVMGMASKELGGQADGKTISNIVKIQLSK
ncbi:glutamyl-tRNA amidotransferase [Pseudalgibacter alginicilyticus]|uniref:Glutamyl-tRNA amidotransferase n=1 Tax=Pseudalgibacter alginicilyticus TaxID=1736674 RepID=A0A0P0DB57_9FLAO|nr:GatB/YqeY domain-containing protein [Pseudalgibacter alginicilyticus]ALJ05148.1 glutamyl-tRNA amidotransferase [Pseudalgibacter alginicilyticus]